MKEQWIKRVSWTILLCLIIIAASGTILSFLGQFNPVLELITNLRLQYLVILAIGTLIALALKKFKIAISAGLLALINLLFIAPLYFGSMAGPLPAEVPHYRALLLNVYWQNQEYQPVIELVRDAEPDFIMFLEPIPAWMSALQPLEQDYPFMVSAIQPDPGSIALFSRIPLTNARILDFGVPERPVIATQMELNGRPLTVIGLHPYPFAARGVIKTEERRQQLEELAQFVTDRPDSVMVLADLNFSPWSPLYQQLLEKSGLRDARKGFGTQITWPTNNPLLYMPIDFALVSQEVAILNHQIGPDIGSDHLPLIVDFALLKN